MTLSPEVIWQNIQELKPEGRMVLFSKLSEEMCSECGQLNGFIKHRDGEIVCTTCGLVQNDGEQSFVATYRQSVKTSPLSNLSFGKSLGDTLSRKGVFQVLAKTVPITDEDSLRHNRKKEDYSISKELFATLDGYLKSNIGLRARFIRIFNSSVDPPCIKKALVIGQQLCSEFGMVGEDAIEFRDYYGKLLRKVSSLAMFAKRKGETFQARRLAVTSFVLVWQLVEVQHGTREKLEYQEVFPSRPQYCRGLQIVKVDEYKIRQVDWQFVLFVHNLQMPTTVMKKNDGDL